MEKLEISNETEVYTITVKMQTKKKDGLAYAMDVASEGISCNMRELCSIELEGVTVYSKESGMTTDEKIRKTPGYYRLQRELDDYIKSTEEE